MERSLRIRSTMVADSLFSFSSVSSQRRASCVADGTVPFMGNVEMERLLYTIPRSSSSMKRMETAESKSRPLKKPKIPV